MSRQARETHAECLIQKPLMSASSAEVAMGTIPGNHVWQCQNAVTNLRVPYSQGPNITHLGKQEKLKPSALYKSP
jgi:hypothetical protein